MTVNQIHQETLTILRDYINQNGFAPSIRELAAMLGYSSSDTGQRRLDALEEAGLIERVGPRAIRIIEEATT